MAEAKKKSTKTKKKAPAAKAAGKKTCKIQNCKRAYRAKGFCFFHYQKWRRGELEDRPNRYKTCSNPECKKKVLNHGLCKDHFDAWKASRKSAKLTAPAATPPPAPAAEAPAETPTA